MATGCQWVFDHQREQYLLGNLRINKPGTYLIQCRDAVSYDDLTKKQQDELLADFSAGKTTICEAGHVDGLERIICELRERISALELSADVNEAIIDANHKRIVEAEAENKRLRDELADIPYRAEEGRLSKKIRERTPCPKP